jgi:glutamate formiminotransferase
MIIDCKYKDVWHGTYLTIDGILETVGAAPKVRTDDEPSGIEHHGTVCGHGGDIHAVSALYALVKELTDGIDMKGCE